MSWDGSWMSWHGLEIPSPWVTILEESLKEPPQKPLGWLWYGPTGSGKTSLVEKWLTEYGKDIPDWQNRVWRIDCSTIFQWDAFLGQLDHWLTRKWLGCENLQFDHWLLIEGSEKITIQHQWDFIQRFRKHTTCGVIWCLSRLQNWIEPLKKGCHIWNWYEFTQQHFDEWEKHCQKYTKPVFPPWNYHSWKWIPVNDSECSFDTLESVFYKAFDVLLQQDFSEWVEVGKNGKLFSIPWDDLVDMFRTKVDSFKQKKEQEVYLQWCARGVELQPFFLGIESTWHQWNQWGWEGINIFQLHILQTLPKSTFKQMPQPDARIWLQKKWEDAKEQVPITNLFLWGPPGGGKTTFVEHWMRKWFTDIIDPRWVYYRNASEDKWMTLFKEELSPFIESDQSRWGDPPCAKARFRWIVLDEVDQMTTDAQEFLRGQMDRIILQNLPIYICLIANERGRVLPQLQARFQMFHWSPPSPEWLDKHLKTPRIKKVTIEKGIPQWWVQYNNDKSHLGWPSRFWQEESGDLRRFIFRRMIDAKYLRSKTVNKLLSRGDSEDQFWMEYYHTTEITKEFWENWDQTPFMNEIKWDSQDLYRFWEKSLDYPPNATWVYWGGDHPESKLLKLFDSFPLRKYQIEQFTIWNEHKSASWVRDDLREYSRRLLVNERKIWVLKNPDDLPEESQICLRRLIDDTRGRIIWWFVITRPHQWMSPLRSRAPLLLLSPDISEIALGKDESLRYRLRSF